jgi:hypothetical protein
MFRRAWAKSGSLRIGRENHTATALQDGRVLLTGGYYYGVRNDTEIWDPQTEECTPAAAMAFARSSHAAVSLPDGRVLVAGGSGKPAEEPFSEIRDPQTGRWGARAAMTSHRAHLSMTLLPTGSILAVGGIFSRAMPLTEEWDPASNTWRVCPDMTIGRFGHTATALADGRVLVAGGASSVAGHAGGVGYLFQRDTLFYGPEACGFSKLDTVEIWNPTSRSWSATGKLARARAFHTAVALRDGRVVVVGGVEQDQEPPWRTTMEIWDPGLGRWRQGPELPGDRYAHTATLLPDGRILLVGGERDDDGRIYLDDTYLWDPSTERWTKEGSLRVARFGHTATMLNDRRVLVVGGVGRWDREPLRGTEVWRPR